MTKTTFKHTGVKKDGTFKNKLGAIITEGAVRMGRGEGCRLKGCNCSNGYYVSIIEPLKRGIVRVTKIEFTSSIEMDNYLKNNPIN